ncbi:MAG TPA: hypothetical protein VM285_16675 [Polyangia bacterium]|nr:hypothetical protein [Polyangia bacterium]
MTGNEPAVDPAEIAYRAGDYGTARRLSRETARNTSRSEPERNRARRILRATGIDPFAAGAFLLTAVVIAYLIIRYVI